MVEAELCGWRVKMVEITRPRRVRKRGRSRNAPAASQSSRRSAGAMLRRLMARCGEMAQLTFTCRLEG